MSALITDITLRSLARSVHLIPLSLSLVFANPVLPHVK